MGEPTLPPQLVLLKPYFDCGPDFIDWQAHIRSVADYWCHVLLYAPGYDIDTIESHRHLHDSSRFTPELFDRRRQRFLGLGVWRPAVPLLF